LHEYLYLIGRRVLKLAVEYFVEEQGGIHHYRI
jgi:hypothetical protein